MATIYDVARRAAVSPATVSRVLNRRASVNAEMAERVHAAVTALGYRPNSVARSLRRQAAPVWAVVISDIENPHFTSLVRGIQDVARANGKSVVLCNSDEDLAEEAQYLDVALAEQMSGIIISPASDRRTDVSALLARGIPVVTIDRRLRNSPVSSVVVDNSRGARSATRHLLAAGYQRVACITGPLTTSTARQRLAGYRQALREAGVPFDDRLVRVSDYKEAGGYASASELLAAARPPDALFVTNSLMTVGSLESMSDLGVRVAQDVGIVGFDDNPWARLMRPALSTVAQPTNDIGRRAAALLLSGTAGQPGVTLTLPTLLIARESSRRDPVPDPPEQQPPGDTPAKALGSKPRRVALRPSLWRDQASGSLAPRSR